MPVFLECQRCTACCRWPGQVRITDAEITRMAAHLQVSENDFIQRYTKLRLDRQGLSLMDKPTGECIFLEDNGCLVQPVKPQQCRDFPNLWNFKGAEKQCKAKPKDVSAEEFRRLVSLATGRPPETIPVQS
jgi:Fe-S-cluster containining protein